jgi:hypothetical protein
MVARLGIDPTSIMIKAQTGLAGSLIQSTLQRPDLYQATTTPAQKLPTPSASTRPSFAGFAGTAAYLWATTPPLPDLTLFGTQLDSMVAGGGFMLAGYAAYTAANQVANYLASQGRTAVDKLTSFNLEDVQKFLETSPDAKAKQQVAMRCFSAIQIHFTRENLDSSKYVEVVRNRLRGPAHLELTGPGKAIYDNLPEEKRTSFQTKVFLKYITGKDCSPSASTAVSVADHISAQSNTRMSKDLLERTILDRLTTQFQPENPVQSILMPVLTLFALGEIGQSSLSDVRENLARWQEGNPEAISPIEYFDAAYTEAAARLNHLGHGSIEHTKIQILSDTITRSSSVFSHSTFRGEALRILKTDALKIAKARIQRTGRFIRPTAPFIDSNDLLTLARDLLYAEDASPDIVIAALRLEKQKNTDPDLIRVLFDALSGSSSPQVFEGFLNYLVHEASPKEIQTAVRNVTIDFGANERSYKIYQAAADAVISRSSPDQLESAQVRQETIRALSLDDNDYGGTIPAKISNLERIIQHLSQQGDGEINQALLREARLIKEQLGEQRG